MSGCAIKRWGPGTPSNKTADTPAAKEMAAALAAMRLERDKQDTMWNLPEKAEPVEIKTRLK